MPEKKPNVPMVPIGATGLKRWGSHVEEEWLPDLRGDKGLKVYREMTDNDSTIGAVLFAIEQIIRGAKWHVHPASQNETDLEAASFIESCMKDLETPWNEFISEVLSMLVYGWSLFEMTYKYRRGRKATKETERSRYNDGRIGWRSFSIRGQETKDGWEWNEQGRPIAIYQRAAPTYERKRIPLDRCLLFRTKITKGSPEGVSVLRNAYTSYYFRKNIQIIEGIGIERDLAGLPVLYAPKEFWNEENARQLEELRDMVRKLRRDEEEGIVLPWDPESKVNDGLLYKLELLSASGRRQFNLSEVLLRYDTAIARSVLADFVFLGIDSRGSYALMKEKRTVFETSLLAWLSSITDVINSNAVPILMEVNPEFSNLETYPEIECELARIPSLTEIERIVNSLTRAGVQIFDDEELESWLRSQIGMPPKQTKKEEEIEDGEFPMEEPTGEGEVGEEEIPLSPQPDQGDGAATEREEG